MISGSELPGKADLVDRAGIIRLADLARGQSAIPLIVNPAAGRGAGARLASWLRETRPMEPPFEVYCSRSLDDARDIAREMAARGCPLVVAAGGDGTAAAVADAIGGSATNMALLPVGTGNDLARHLGLPLRPGPALSALLSMASVPVDLGRAGSRPFLVAAGIGFDAAVARSVNEQPRWLRGSLAYAVAVLSTLRSYQPTLLHISVDGVTHEYLAYMAAIANIRTYGGGMRIAPNASMRDGLLDVCVVKALPRWRFLMAAGSVYRGAHVRHPAVHMFRGRTIRIQSEPPAPVVLDGELAGATPVELTVEPGGIRLAIQSPYDSI